ncbi:MAG: hypothetical protein FWD61_20455 [Phycisphaerales bacterium]|nr:hypothetical protein [Phycisphaerales bacterium]
MNASDNEKISLTFSLNRFQRIANPVERWFFAFLGGIGLLGCACVTIKVSLLAPFPEKWFSLLFIALFCMFWWMFGRIIRSLCLQVLCNKYINILEIDSHVIKFGIDSLEAVIPHFQAAAVGKGLFRTYIIRLPHAGESFTIPRTSVDVTVLKRVLERAKSAGAGPRSRAGSDSPQR